ncbi:MULTISPECIES: prephenate dehydratase [unclassified Frankia]|uniref:prephenate dehydratase n=2 Tax=Frankia TaxID=1854 RepID=UPI002AD479DB|nr:MULTISPECIES: prephenate dehydratase [unclassified Frankia]
MTGRKKIAFQGELGANSHLACQNVYPDYEPVPFQTFEECFAAIENGSADLGMIPVENSTAGRVADIHYLLPDSSVYIIGEYFLPVHHQLLGLPGATLADLRTVHSHPQALAQCRVALRELGLPAVAGADTAGCAREVAEAGDPTRGAIASELAAEAYGLQILKADLKDEEHNTTRFMILSSKELRAAAGIGPIVSTFVFKVSNLPAALYKALGGFATNGVNMTKLESYMVGGQFIATQFLADIEGHPDEPHVGRAFTELGYFAEYRILGVYRANPFREQIKNIDGRAASYPGPAALAQARDLTAG